MMLSRTNRQRALVAVVEVLALSAWFSATAVVPTLRFEWGIGATAAVWLTASVQIGFVAGAITSTVFNLADRITPQHLLAASALGAAACTAALALVASGSPRRSRSQIPHRDVPRRRLSGGDGVDGVMVGIHRSRPYVRGSAGSTDHRLRPPTPHHRPRTAALENGDAGRGGTDCGGRRRRPRGGSARPPSGRPHGRPESALRARPAHRPRSAADQSRLFRAHVGALRPVDLAADVRRRRPGRTRRRGPWGRPGSSRSALSESQGPSDAYWVVGRQTVRPPSGGGGGAGDQRNLLRGITTILRRPDAASRGLPLGVGYRRHRRLRCLLHRAQRDDGHPVRRHRPDRADRDRLPVDRCHHPTRSCRRRTDRLAIRISASCTRPPARCPSDVGPTPPPPTQGAKQ